jgi:hypothetical protein
LVVAAILVTHTYGWSALPPLPAHSPMLGSIREYAPYLLRYSP